MSPLRSEGVDALPKRRMGAFLFFLLRLSKQLRRGFFVEFEEE